MTAIRILANLSTTTCFFSAPPSDRDFLNKENTFDWFIYLERRKIQIGKGTDERLFVCGNSCQWPESLNFPLKVVIEDNLASGLDELSHPDAQNLCGDSIYCQVFTCCERSSHASAPEADTGLCHASAALGSICNVDIVNHL